MTANKATPEELARCIRACADYMEKCEESPRTAYDLREAADLIESLVQKKQQEPHVHSSVTADLKAVHKSTGG